MRFLGGGQLLLELPHGLAGLQAPGTLPPGPKKWVSAPLSDCSAEVSPKASATGIPRMGRRLTFAAWIARFRACDHPLQTFSPLVGQCTPGGRLHQVGDQVVAGRLQLHVDLGESRSGSAPGGPPAGMLPGRQIDPRPAGGGAWRRYVIGRFPRRVRGSGKRPPFIGTGQGRKGTFSAASRTGAMPGAGFQDDPPHFALLSGAPEWEAARPPGGPLSSISGKATGPTEGCRIPIGPPGPGRKSMINRPPPGPAQHAACPPPRHPVHRRDPGRSFDWCEVHPCPGGAADPLVAPTPRPGGPSTRRSPGLQAGHDQLPHPAGSPRGPRGRAQPGGPWTIAPMPTPISWGCS